LIKFKTLKWKNFLSTGNVYTELDLDRNPSTLVIGDNGAGKSTFLDALSYALYSKPFRKVSKPQLINSINKKDLKVEIVFTVGQNTYKIIRGSKPNVFEIWQNGKMINQDAAARDYQEYLEKQVLKLSHKAFSQVVVLGSTSFVPFMQLSSMNRREVIEDLLDLQIFSVMNNLLKDRVSSNNKDILEIDHSINLLEEKISLTQEHIAELEADNRKRISSNMIKVADNTAQIEGLKGTTSVLTEELESLKGLVKDKQTIKARYEKLKELRTQLNSKINDLQTQLDFYESNDQCPTCDQSLEGDFVENAKCNHTAKITEVESGTVQLQTQLQEIEVRLEEIAQIQEDIIVKQNELSEVQWKSSTLVDTNIQLKEENSQLSDAKGSKAKEQERLTGFETKLVTSEQSKNEAVMNRAVLSVVSTILKDTGIKTKIIKQYVPIMNKLINKYLAAMDFFVQFELDESFNETIKSRFRDDFSYASFSEGEKMRIDLALLFTWRSISKIRNSASTNLLVMDEVFDSSLDSTGTDEFLKIINELTSDTNVFIISHKGDTLLDKFHHIIKFEKVKSFSRMAS
tara:strand:+ start:3052 stop:4767 length:1716 start_codon:yes stop_codon:yes gene_type:complete